MNAAESSTQILPADHEVDENAGQYLTFMLAGEEYGVDILRVQEIRGWEKAAKIPNTPSYVRGVINLRGTIVPIIDLRHRFGLEEVEYGRTTVVVVLRVEDGEEHRVMGVVVDAVSDVYNIGSEHMKPAPDFGMGMKSEFARGLATMDEKMIIVLDIDMILSAKELARVVQSEPVTEEEAEEGSAEEV
ncbi:MAG: chemotaxis protein CheW [bacterium]|nr:chemotaxis protein CheW [bacterium]